jgi:hypothetical protein
MSLDGYVVFSHYSCLYLRILSIDTLRLFDISFFFVINIIFFSGWNNIVRERPLAQFYLLYCCNIT